MTTVPLSAARGKLSALVDAVETTPLMAESDLDSLHETLFWLSQPGIRDDVTRHDAS